VGRTALQATLRCVTPTARAGACLAEPASPITLVEYIWTTAILARAYCQTGDRLAGWSALSRLDATLGGNPPEAFQQRSELHETRATCLFSDGQLTQALTELDLAEASALPPGRIVERADCQVLRARIHAVLAQPHEASAALDAATAIFLEQSLDDHPYLEYLANLRRELLQTG
jgi:hypothetical protein